MKIIVKNLTIILLGSVMIVGCGRKGALELPPATVGDSLKSASVSQSKADKPFVLDRLIQ
ncbi:hypothetical protein MEI_00764 [Bartonella vinsonii subsp. arupensis Pm136co]|uniref:Lipoprotein n=1 Tax=Bartonella vinsonii subsp. arupensis Pm136co TaxID=1094561 RepID=A0ABN0GQK1_BARVI|nr:lipoprotein [Bartonella vinsonii]EJF98265.1 hypothetical protein MEI_00764 [Bartonella vinsonii subsp. arupensis Pm136co]